GVASGRWRGRQERVARLRGGDLCAGRGYLGEVARRGDPITDEPHTVAASDGSLVGPGSSGEVECAAGLANGAPSSPDFALSPCGPSHVEQRLEPGDGVIE